MSDETASSAPSVGSARPPALPPTSLRKSVVQPHVRVSTRPAVGASLSAADEEEEPTDPGLGQATPLPLPASAKHDAFRQRLVLQILLAAVPGLSSQARSLALVRSAGLKWVCEEPLDSLTRRLGTSGPIAQRLQIECDRYLEGTAARSVRGLSRAAELRAHVARLRERTEEFARCEDDNRAERRTRRNRLQRATTDVFLLLAEQGEQGLLRELERLSKDQRVEHLERLVEAGEP